MVRQALLLVALCAIHGKGAAFELGDLLRTPGERAAAALDAATTPEARARLVESAPGSEWAAHARYRDGAAEAAEAAVAAFEARLAIEEDPGERHRLGYNRATALVRAGRPDEAVAAFDALLAARPDDVEAAANRDVAQRLVELQRRDPSPDDADAGSDAGGEADAGDGAGDPEAGAGASDPDAGETGEAGETGRASDADGASAGDAGTAGTTSRDGSETGPEDGDVGEASSEAGARAATEALDGGSAAGDATGDAGSTAADAGSATEDAGGEPGDDVAGVSPTMDAPPLGEREQVVEQWLQRIPDDPSGLLRGKLLQSHRRDWPDVREGGGGL